MIRFLFDTNVLSELVRERPDRNLIDRYRLHEREAGIASIVLHELLYGVERLRPGRRRDSLARYMTDVVERSLPVLPYDRAAAQWHAAERARLEQMGRTPSFADGMIAAIAATRGLILVTRNTADFEAFNEIHIENWFSE